MYIETSTNICQPQHEFKQIYYDDDDDDDDDDKHIIDSMLIHFPEISISLPPPPKAVSLIFFLTYLIIIIIKKYKLHAYKSKQKSGSEPKLNPYEV